MPVGKQWIIKSPDNDKVDALQSALGINRTLCKLLINREIDTFEVAKDFFRPHKGLLHDPYLMKGMQDAVFRISEARNAQESIFVFGDYDVDGTTSVAIVYDFLAQNRLVDTAETTLHFYIPHRYKEGYGLSFEGIDEAIKLGCTLMITLDCGIKSIEKVAYANAQGLDVIICDHHNPGDELPQAIAILNPKQEDCQYPFKELSACGIGYKLIAALAQAWDLDDQQADKYLDLVATSIAADIVPLNGENRVLAYLGLEKANNDPCLSLATLKEMTKMEKAFSISDLVFTISPRINAAGRMDEAKKAVELFVAQTKERAVEIAALLQSDNTDRKEIDKQTTEEALSILAEETWYRTSKSTVLFRPHWHKGVVGIVASRIIDHYHRPTIILTASNGKATGSARSVVGFNIHDAIQSCADLLDTFGGHFFAAGMTMPLENVPLFIARFEEEVSNTIQEASILPRIEIDAALDFDDITPSFIRILKQFEPFGPNNMRPVFLTEGVHNIQSTIVKEQHIRFVVGHKGITLSGIGFGMAAKFPIIEQGFPFDVVYTLEENEWKGNTTIQLRVIDIRPHVA